MPRVRTQLAALLCVLVIGLATAATKSIADEKTALAPTEKLRVGLYLGNPLSAVRDSSTQELKGLGFELGQHLARRLQVPFEPVVYPSVGALLEAAKAKEWDIAFFQVSPARAKDFDFTHPLVEIELGYLVSADSRLRSAAEADKSGVRIAVQEKSQSDAILSRLLKSATIVRVGGLAAALEALKSGNADAIATVKPSLFELSNQFAGSRVLEGSFAQEYIAMALPKGCDAGVPYVQKFVEEAKAGGLVKGAIERAGARGVIITLSKSTP